MENTSTKKRIGMLALLAASAIGLALAAPAAGAPGYGDEKSYNQNGNEEIEVTAPRSHARGEYGAPIRDVAISREVRFDDLNLRTGHGVRVLKTRIRSMARVLCTELDAMHPVAADNSPPCYQTAVRDAMYQADDAIAQARLQAANEE